MSDAALHALERSVDEAHDAFSSVASVADNVSKTIKEFMASTEDDADALALPHTQAEARALLDSSDAGAHSDSEEI